MALPIEISSHSAKEVHHSHPSYTNHDMQYPGGDTSFALAWKTTSGGRGWSNFSFGVGYRIKDYAFSGNTIRWSISCFAYISQESNLPGGVSSPQAYIDEIRVNGSQPVEKKVGYLSLPYPKTTYGTTVGANGCVARWDIVTTGTSINFRYSMRLKTINGSATVDAPKIYATLPTINRYTKTFKSMKDGLSLSGIRLNWGDSFGSRINITKWQGESSTTPTLNNTSTSVNTTKDVNVRFYNEGTLVDTKTGTVKATQNYSASWNWAGTSIALGGSMQFNSGGTYWPDWGPSGTAEPTTAFKPILPTTERTGYKFKEWVAEDGESCGVTGTSKKGFQYDARVNATWTPLEYKFRYIISREATSSLKPKSIDPFTKTYGTPIKLSDIIPEWTDKRLLFAGWKGSKTGKIYQPGQTIDDAEFTNKSTIVDLEAQWNPNPNTINLIYYYDGGFKNPDRRTYSYNDISSGQIWRINAPVWIDHSFIGWSAEKPAGFDSNKGVYMSEEDIPATIKHNIINNLVISKDKPSMYIPWSRTDTYYGIWIKTGKKMKLSPSSAEEPRWIDIQTVYFNSPSGWKKVTDIWVKTPNGWKHEI